MMRPDPLLQGHTTAQPGKSRNPEAASQHEASGANRSASSMPESTADQLESQLLIEMRYQQYLAQQGLQELFEKAELGCLER